MTLVYRRQISKSRWPMSFCTALTVSLSCLAIAWPRSDSTLKLFVLVGKIRNATTVTSLCSDCTQTIKQQINQKHQTNNLASSLWALPSHTGIAWWAYHDKNRIIYFIILTQHCYTESVSSDHISRLIFLPFPTSAPNYFQRPHSDTMSFWTL